MLKEEDPYYFGAGTRWTHQCWSCEYSEVEIESSRPALTVVQGGRSGADRLKRVRLGESDAS